MVERTYNSKNNVRQIALLFTAAFLTACPVAAWYTNDFSEIFLGLLRIFFSPGPLVTDYYNLGSLSSAFLNAGICGAVFTFLLYAYRLEDKPADLAGYFLVVAHCFYGLNLVNMIPPVLGIALYCRYKKLSFKDNLSIAMFSTAFGPFIGEILFRYPLRSGVFSVFGFTTSITGIIFALLLGAFLGFAIPAMLPGGQKLHRGYNLYNAGLAFGLLGLLIFAFLYKTFGLEPSGAVQSSNPVYDSFGRSYLLFCDLFFVSVFLLCLFIGWKKNNHTFSGYKRLTKDTGFKTDFFKKYGGPSVWVNIAAYGFLVLLYFNAVILFTDGAGFTGATCGVTLAALSFSAQGQHPKNTWQIMAGYMLLSALVTGISLALKREIPWTLSTQGYINGLAFATGLCPIAGSYGTVAGILAGFTGAIICTSTSAFHGGFVLYNGGFTAGLAAILLLPMLDHYYQGNIRS